jgi:hypothetical protein
MARMGTGQPLSWFKVFEFGSYQWAKVEEDDTVSIISNRKWAFPDAVNQL